LRKPRQPGWRGFTFAVEEPAYVPDKRRRGRARRDRVRRDLSPRHDLGTERYAFLAVITGFA
jgi:hypothetical protein